MGEEEELDIVNYFKIVNSRPSTRENIQLDLSSTENKLSSDVMSGQQVSVVEPRPSMTWKPRKEKRQEQIKSRIKAADYSQNRDWIRMQAEIRRRGEIGNSETGSETQKGEEIPMPQRTPKDGPRITSNIQVVPPKPDGTRSTIGEKERDPLSGKDHDDRNSAGNSWNEVGRRKRGGGLTGKRKQDKAPKFNVQSRKQMDQVRGYNADSVKPAGMSRRTPKTAAMMVTKWDNDLFYAEVLKKAREAIPLDELKIDKTKIRKAFNGDMIIEVIGPDGSDRANALTDRLRSVLKDQAKVARPVVKGEIRLVGLDDSVSADEVIYTVAQNGGCREEEVRTGSIRSMNNGLYTIWAQCPLSAAIKIANMKKVRIGWTMARVDLLEARPVQCFKCWKFEHVRLACTSGEDYSKLCFKCGGDGHLARNCNLPPSCKLCVAEDKNPNHRLGSNLCTAENKVSKIKTNFRTILGIMDKSKPNPAQRDIPMDTDAH